jgi:hypothetical protein
VCTEKPNNNNNGSTGGKARNNCDAPKVWTCPNTDKPVCARGIYKPDLNECFEGDNVVGTSTCDSSMDMADIECRQPKNTGGKTQ